MNKIIFTKSVFSYLLLLTASFIFTQKVLAEEDFTADYSMVYDIEGTGVANVKHSVTITNQKDDVIATSYTLSLKQIDAYEITASDKNGKLDVIEKKGPEETTVEIKLKSFVIGEGRQTTVNVAYKSRQVAIKTGDIWTITIPRAQSVVPSASYNVQLLVPTEFGPEIFVTPIPAIKKTEKNKFMYSFADEQLKDTNISASFGKFQIYNFKLKYQLINNHKLSGDYEIALPPDVENMQVVRIENINPQPKRVYLDEDKNLMAVYKIKASQSINVEVTGAVKISSKQIDPTKGATFDKLDLISNLKHLRSQKYWETQDKNIVELAKKLKEPDKTVSQNTYNIYKYLLDNYSYDFEISKRDFVTRQGAAKAISGKIEWGCMEFTDSFVAISRSMGIPARELNGYAITDSTTKPISVSIKSGDLLHAWPEFYDPAFGWVQIDPTWGDTSGSDYFTKLDTNHIAFVIKGINSDYPYPAGTYRASETDKLVDVSLAEQKSEQNFSGAVEVKKTFGFNIIKLIAGYRPYYVKNIGQVIITFDNKIDILPGKSQKIYIPQNIRTVKFTNALGEVLITNL